MPVPSVLDDKILDKQNNYIYSVLKYKNILPKLVGTSSLLSQSYPADIDMICPIDIKPLGFNEVQRQFQNIFKRFDSYPNLFFVEFKLQNIKKDEKYKFFNKSDVNSSFFKDHYDSNKIDICKIDLLQFNNGIFQEISCIYFFNKIDLDMQKYINQLLTDQKHYVENGKYYKSLKRFMIASKLQTPPNVNAIVGISNFFNSFVGKAYQLSNYLMACEIYIGKYGVDDRVRMFLSNIGLEGLDESKISDVISEYEKLYNGEAKKFYKHFKIPVGRLMPFQEKRFEKFAGKRKI
jgi:hypothetical protein